MRKAAKAFNNVVFQLVTIMHQLKAAEKSLERIRGRKRRKVQVDPNTQFAGIKEVRASQREASRDDLSDSETEELGNSDIEDYIIVAT